MKTYKHASTSKLVTRFDNELVKIIRNDLKAIRAAKTQFLNSVATDHLTAA